MTLQQVTSGILVSECSLIGSGVWYREHDGAPVYSPHELETHYRMHKCKICIWGLNRHIMYATHSLTNRPDSQDSMVERSVADFFLLPPHQQKAGMSWANWAGRPGGGGGGWGNTASSLPPLSVRRRVFSPISPNHSAVKPKKTVTSMHICAKTTLMRPKMRFKCVTCATACRVWKKTKKKPIGFRFLYVYNTRTSYNWRWLYHGRLADNRNLLPALLEKN